MFGSREMRRLTTKWTQGNHWPKRLEWLEIKNIRGWTGHRIEFKYPITAIVGENGSGSPFFTDCSVPTFLISLFPFYSSVTACFSFTALM